MMETFTIRSATCSRQLKIKFCERTHTFTCTDLVNMNYPDQSEYLHGEVLGMKYFKNLCGAKRWANKKIDLSNSSL